MVIYTEGVIISIWVALEKGFLEEIILELHLERCLNVTRQSKGGKGAASRRWSLSRGMKPPAHSAYSVIPEGRAGLGVQEGAHSQSGDRAGRRWSCKPLKASEVQAPPRARAQG